ncbi:MULTISPECIES: hypothetical protein [unclassified Streptomyces]
MTATESYTLIVVTSTARRPRVVVTMLRFLSTTLLVRSGALARGGDTE